MRIAKFMIVFLIISGPILFGVWRWSFQEALTQLETRATASLSLASDRLVGRLERYRMLPVVLSRDQTLLAALGHTGVTPAIKDRLRHLADLTRSLRISLVATDGTIIEDSTPDTGVSLRGTSIANRPDFRRAMNGALGFYHAQENTTLPRGFNFAHPLRNEAGAILGALVVKADLESLEFHWRGEPETIFFADENNVIFIANRDDLILRQMGWPAAPTNLTRYGGTPLTPLPDPQAVERFGRTIWHSSGDLNLPRRALLVSQTLPVIGMEAYILTDLDPATEQAELRTLLAAALFAMVALVLWSLQIRRDALARQLSLRKEVNAQLEARVERRTDQLRRTQDDLVQAGKLSALGQMSAGISHELNQPLAAIQTFSENAGVFLQRGDTDKAKGNLERIASLTTRMARIIKNLRAFSRKEGEVASDVPLDKVIDDALEIAQNRISKEGVAIDWQPAGILAHGGAVRLQQVVLNLISNAIDAMEGAADKRIWISVTQTGDTVRLLVRDNGPGLETPEKIFDPFYSTKPVSDDSLGLGLSISYGIVQSFGGAIKGENHVEGGAVFTVTLTAAKGTTR